MSALALETSRFFYVTIKSVYSFFEILLEAIVLARQEQANFEVAKMLYYSGEYRNESFDYILRLVREGNLDELYSKKTR